MSAKQFYIFNSRIVTHIIFWVVYYVGFSLIWSSSQGLRASFFLEFVLLPIRIAAVYATIYILLPNYLIKKKYVKFLATYAALILAAALLQRIFIHFFYEDLLLKQAENLFSLKMLLRAIVLINTTVFLVLSFRVFQLFLLERDKNEKKTIDYLEIKADRRVHRVNLEDILFVEGQGNYTTYHLANNSKITAYGSVKKALANLPKNFIRVHKSYIVNKDEIKSFDVNTIDVNGQLIPRGKSADDGILSIH